ncbi:MAG: hypothetical protein V4546_16675 [Bacteroidota bacterium]
MITLEYQIFTPEKRKFKITPNFIVYGLWIFSILLFAITNKLQDLKILFEPYKTVYLIILVLLPIYFSIAAFFKHKPINGAISGILQIGFDLIIVTDNHYSINNISKIDFHFIDYFGQLQSSVRANFNPLLSQGVSNAIEFTDKNNQIHLVYFKLNYKYEHERLFPFITEMIKINKISFLRGIELLGINDYDKIQEFKKQLKS